VNVVNPAMTIFAIVTCLFVGTLASSRSPRSVTNLVGVPAGRDLT
jgi:hypothetical protein